MISAVLISWKRPDELARVIEHLKQYEFIDDIVVHENTPGDNLGVYGRYLAAHKAKHDIIYTQDDDCLVKNIPELYRLFLEQGGTTLVNAMKPIAIESYKNRRYGDGYETLLGWGSLFKDSWTDCLTQYTNAYRDDSILYDNADRIFTALLQRPHVTIEADLEEFPAATGAEAMSLQPGYLESREEAMNRVLCVLGR